MYGCRTDFYLYVWGMTKFCDQNDIKSGWTIGRYVIYSERMYSYFSVNGYLAILKYRTNFSYPFAFPDFPFWETAPLENEVL